MSRSEESRTTQIRRLFTAAGIPGLESKHSTIYGIKGWRITVTNQVGDNTNGESIYTRLTRLNREMPTVIVRTRKMRASALPTHLDEAPALITVGRLAELIAFWDEHHREERA